MADLSPRPGAPASSPSPRVAELLQLCAADYKAGAPQRIADHRDDAHLVPHIPAPVTATGRRLVAAGYVRRAPQPQPEPSTLDTAIRVAQNMLDAYGDSSGDSFAYPEAYGALRESLRILLHALGAEAVDAR